MRLGLIESIVDSQIRIDVILIDAGVEVSLYVTLDKSWIKIGGKVTLKRRSGTEVGSVDELVSKLRDEVRVLTERGKKS